MIHTNKLLEAIRSIAVMRSIAIIAMAAVIGFSMAGCNLSYEDDDEDNNNQRIFFPEVLAGTVNYGGVLWDKDGESEYVVFKNTAHNGVYRAYFSCNSIFDYVLNAKNGDTYTVRRYWDWNEEENDYYQSIFIFTAIVGVDGKLTISNATLIKDAPSYYSSIAQAVNDLNGVYTIKEN